jgi:hypothetical protein
MSTAAPTVERGDTAAYQNKLLGLLGNRDPIEVLSQTPGIIQKIARENEPAVMRKRPFPGKWTPTEIIGHLCDSEWVYGYRIRLILCEERPTILGMDQELWVNGQRYNERDPRELADQYAALRGINLHVWRNLKPADHARMGFHNERGGESLGLMVRMEAGHDLSHIDQLTRYITAAKA